MIETDRTGSGAQQIFGAPTGRTVGGGACGVGREFAFGTVHPERLSGGFGDTLKLDAEVVGEFVMDAPMKTM